jgi:perosamine synthetase
MATVETPLARLSLARPDLGEREVDAAARAIRSGWVTQGPEVAAFEREFAAAVGAPHACAVANATAALHLALCTVGVSRGDEVVTVSHSFIATANAVRYCGAVPVFVDIDPLTFNIDVAQIERAITSRTRAILCVHQLGMPCDLAAVVAIAARHGLPVVEDAACAAGSEILWNGNWERIGAPHGDIACFSFHPRKVITTGDGGMLTTRRAEWDRQFRLARQHGMSIPDVVRHAAPRVLFEQYLSLGYNYRMTDVQAAIGREQLARLDDLVAGRRALAARYHALLARIPGVGVPHEPEWARSNWQSYCVRLPDGVSQRDVMQAMLDAGVDTRRGVMCAHRQPAYRAEPWSCGATVCACRADTCRRLAESERAEDTCIMVPLHSALTDLDQVRVVVSLAAACANASPRADRVA